MIFESLAIGYFLWRTAQAFLEANELADASSATAPDAIVALLGRPSAGKSSVGNALVGRNVFAVGVEHGTTTTIQSVDHGSGYAVRDTPGIMTADGQEIDKTLGVCRDSSVVVYVTGGQLFQLELGLLEAVSKAQREWDRQAGSPGRRSLIVFVNKLDVKEQTMPEAERRRELEATRLQCLPAVSAGDIVVGSASPLIQGLRGAPRVEELKALIARRLARRV